jgi:hypothetical protein
MRHELAPEGDATGRSILAPSFRPIPRQSVYHEGGRVTVGGEDLRNRFVALTPNLDLISTPIVIERQVWHRVVLVVFNLSGIKSATAGGRAAC